MTPKIGEWYKLIGSGRFEVISYDEDEGLVEVQYEDGTVEEWEIDEWEGAWGDGNLKTTEEPDDDEDDQEDEDRPALGIDGDEE